MNRAGQTICLNMIVRNEAPVIRRCLDSVMPLIDSWVIVDTGSTDGTQDIVREHLAHKPGALHERPWVDFAHNRSEALDLARGQGDYVFVIDADEVLEIDSGFQLPPLEADSYNVEMDYAGCLYLRRTLLRNALSWRYVGVLHEYTVCDEAKTEAFLPGLRTKPHRDGARARDPSTYRKDALLLEKALIDEPDNARYVFYLAQSYRDCGDLELAIRHYRRRLELEGWYEEAFYSRYQIAMARERLGHPWPEVMEEYLAAWQMMPDRAGPLYRIGVHYQRLGQYHLAHLHFRRAMEITPPGPQRLFVEQSIYDCLLPLEYAVSCFYVGDQAAAIRTNNALLAGPRTPPELVDQIVRNRRFSVDVVAPVKPGEPAGGPLHVLVPLERDEPAIDDLVESLGRQSGCRFRVAFFGAEAERLRGRLALEDGRFALVGSAADWLAAAAAHDPVLVLPPGRIPAEDDRLARIRAMFDDPACLLAYGQQRRADGGLGRAQPAADEADFAARGAALADGAPFAARASILLSGGRLAEPEEAFRSACFAGTRFSDDVWTIAEPQPLPPMRPAAPAIAGTAPKISCLMVTYDRLLLAKRAIRSFAAQTWPAKELVIVTDGTERFRAALGAYAEWLGLDSVRIVAAEGAGLTLGRLRNLSLEEAQGDWICQWDDDDFSHPDRLAVQAAHMAERRAGACFLTDHLQHLADERALCWVDWTAGGRIAGTASLAPGTLMMRSGLGVAYPEDGPHARSGEDSVLLEALGAAAEVAPLSGAGHLYLYQYHGANTFSREHHLRISQFRTSAEHLRAHGEKVKETARICGLARPCFAVGADGPAFAL